MHLVSLRFRALAIALTVEYAPRGRRQLYNALMFAGYSVGGVLAAGRVWDADAPSSRCRTCRYAWCRS